MNAKQILVSVLSGLAGGALVFFALSYHDTHTTKEDTHPLVSSYEKNSHTMPLWRTSGNSGTMPSSIPEVDFTQAAESSLGAVVHITSKYNQPNYTLYDFFFGTQPRSSRPVMSTGSGVIISEDGYVVTNNHVIDQSEQIKVVLNDKRSFDAKLIGTDASTDLALLKIDEENLPHIPYGNSDELKVGKWVLAIGNPFNLNSTVTAGIVSAKARNINIMEDQYGIESFIQTDAAVNPGNSGGALVNTSGELVGINTAIASRTGSYIGYSFAIPVCIVKKIVGDLVEYGEVQRAYMGLSLADIDAEIAKRFKLGKIQGVLIAAVSESGAATDAGIEAGDVIIGFEGNEINSVSQLMEKLSVHRPGDMVRIKVKRDKKVKDFTLELQNKYGDTRLVESQSIEALGAKFEKIPEEYKHALRITHGVQVKDLHAGKLMSKGVKDGFIITRINNKTVKEVKDIERILAESDGGIFIEGIYPNGMVSYYAFGL